MNILVTIPVGLVRDTFIPSNIEEKINALGNVQWNNSEKQLSTEELKQKIQGVDICITGWGTPLFTEDVLENADKLKMIAHTGGSVAPVVSECVYQKGIKVISGNLLYAESVAEAVIAYSLASLRDIPFYNYEMHAGRWADRNYYNEGLLDQTVGFVGFGMITRCLVEMLKPFRTKIKVYSNYVTDAELEKYQMKRASLEEIFSTCKIISIHSALTPKTHHMIGRRLLEMIPEGSLLVNTARGSVIDEAALADELQKKRFKAVLDVYEAEPLPRESRLIGLENAILIPHMGGPTIDRRKFVTLNIIDDIKNFMDGRPLKLEISREHAVNMTR